MSPKFVFSYTILVSLVRFFCGPLKARAPFRIHFQGECCQNYKLHFVAKFFVRFVDFKFVQCFPDSVLVVWFLKSLVKKKKNMLGKAAVFGGPRATAGHRKYSGILEKFYQWPLFYSQHSRSAFLVSIRVSICYVIKQTSRRIIQ